MRSQPKSVCLIASGIVERNLRLQPWRYLFEVSSGLAYKGYEVTIITTGNPGAEVFEEEDSISIIRIPSIRNPLWCTNNQLQDTLSRIAPDVILWHVSQLSFLYQQLEGPPGTTIIGIFTSPIYHLRDLSHLGMKKLVRSYRLTTLHVLSSLVPKWLYRYLIEVSKFACLVVQTETTRRQLVEQGLWGGEIRVIPPGVDKDWRKPGGSSREDLRSCLGYQPEDILIVFFGSPEPLRGGPTLVQAFTLAHSKDASLKLMILSRRRKTELRMENRVLEKAIFASQYNQHIQVINGFLNQEDLIRYVAVGDIVALPFELVPSDAPLSLIEAGAL
ncbi:MAG: glycosyltransferase family 4 protein, partial [Anaerolineales bacterium]|nr:glycosyltransferase family 4 protein [Anaerolineales bacterium]